MKLGEMLIRDDRINEVQLDLAIQQQGRDGGRLGTVMVEMGFIDLDTLTVYLGLELGIPIASGAALERAKKLAVRVLRPEQAAHYRIVPLLIHDRQLIAAVDDPHDMQALDEILRITGYRVLPRVAPEIRIFYYLERYYGVPRPRRFEVFGDTPRGQMRSNDDLPAPPLPGLPPVPVEKVEAPRPAPPLHAMPTGPVVVDDDDEYEEIDLDADDLLVELEADHSDAAAEAPLQPRGPAQSSAELVPPPADETYEPLPLDQALEAMRGAENRNVIATTLMGHVVSLFELSALCIVRDNMAFGWKVSGGDVDADRIETLLVPLGPPSVFQSAVADDTQLFYGAPFPATLHNYLFKVMRTPPPRYVVVRAVSIGKRMVNLLYGHRLEPDPLTEEQLAGLNELCDLASQAYVRLIASSKKGRARARRAAAADKKRVVIAVERDESTGEVALPEPSSADGAGAAPAADSPDETTTAGKRSARKGKKKKKKRSRR